MSHQMEHSLDPEKLSAYIDDTLDELERRQVEEHLALCAACRDRLADYRWIGSSLRAIEPRPVPLTIDARIADLISGQPAAQTGRHLFSVLSFRPAIATALLVALLSAVILFGLPARDTGTPMVAAAYLYEEQGMTAIAVEFNRPVDRQKVEETLRIEPPVEVSVAWRGDTMVVKPAKPLETRTNYTVRVNPLGRDSKATPVALPVLPSKPTQVPVTHTTEAVAALASPTSTATATPTTPAIAASPSPTIVAASPTAATPGAVEPVGGFGLFLQSRPDIAGKLGKAQEPERGVEMVIQPFEGGYLVWRGDRKEILALLANGNWKSYPDTFDGWEEDTTPEGEPVRGFGKLWRDNAELRSALGTATAPEQPIGGGIQPFEQGTMLWTADQTIYVLYADGMWERYEDAYPPTTPTATITTTPMPEGSSTPTAIATTPTVSSTPGATSIPAGTPSTPEATVAATPTIGEGTPEGTPTATVGATPSPTAEDGLVTPTTTATASPSPTPVPTMPRKTATPVPTPTITPTASATPTYTPTPIGAECAIQPQRGFGLVYQENPTTATRLGCAKSEEVALQLARQGFENGLMIWRSDTREIVTLRRDGRWFVHPDTWQEGEILDDIGPAPEGMFVPERGIGKVWRQQILLRETLGWAVAPEQPIPGVVQQFTGGAMLWTGDRVIYILYPDGTWRGFADTYVPPASNEALP